MLAPAHCIAQSLPRHTAREEPKAAVAAILLPAPPPRLLAIERAARPGDPWAGDIAFPGGMLRPGEHPRRTAERETREETGLPPSCLEHLALIGSYRPLNRPGLLVEAHFYLLDEECLWRWRPGPEAERITVVHIPCSPEARPILHPRRGIVVSAYKDWLGNTIWGMTLRILDAVSRAVRSCWPCASSK